MLYTETNIASRQRGKLILHRTYTTRKEHDKDGNKKIGPAKQVLFSIFKAAISS